MDDGRNHGSQAACRLKRERQCDSEQGRGRPHREPLLRLQPVGRRYERLRTTNLRLVLILQGKPRCYMNAPKEVLEEVKKKYERSLVIPNTKPSPQWILMPVGVVGSGKTTVVKPLA